MKIFKNAYFYGTALIAVGTLLGSFFSYLLQFFLGRTLSIEDFGSFNALLSLAYIIGVPASVVGISIVKVVANLKAAADYSKIKALFTKLSLVFAAGGLVVFFVGFLLKDYISQQLNILDTNYIIAFCVYLGILLISSLPGSFLQGLLKYKELSFYTVLASFYRFVLPVVGVYLGFKVSGVYGGMFIGILLAYLTAYLFMYKDFGHVADVNLDRHLKKILTFSFPVLFVNLGMMILNNVDVILVKKYFDPELAGFYAGTVTLGKIFLFGAGAVTTVMFPLISSVYAKGEAYTEKFKKLLTLQVLVAFGGLAVFTTFPKIITELFFGDRFLHSVAYLPKFAIFVLLYVLINFLVMYFLAIEKTRVALFLLPGVLLQFVLILTNHATLYDVINANISAGIITLVLLSLYAKKAGSTT